jgi:hypothetical protein
MTQSLVPYPDIVLCFVSEIGLSRNNPSDSANGNRVAGSISTLTTDILALLRSESPGIGIPSKGHGSARKFAWFANR